MAVVYRGLDRSLKRHVAVKVLHRHLADHDEARDRFEREAHAVAKLRHENILEIFDYSGKVGGESYIVTEFIDGQTLKQFVTDHPPRFAEIGAMIVVQICRALSHAHGHGVLHRDVKPENVMIRSDGVVKLTDFGISQMVDAQRMTVTGQLLGSPAYMSPEHVEGRPLDFRTDVFAAGIVLYQLTVGKLPFEGRNPHEILKRIAECRFSDPRQANPRVGNELGRVILKAMARDPDGRYPVITAMLTDLEQYLEGSGLSSSKDELARYFPSPAAYELALGARLTDHLLRRAKQALPQQRASALQLLDRVLTIEPKHTAALELLDSLERRRRWRQALGIAAVVAVAGGGAWAARRALTGGSANAGAPGDAIAAALVDDAATTADATLPAPLDAAATDARAVDAALLAPLADARRSGDDPRRLDARPGPDAGAATDLRFKITVFPKGSEVQLGGDPWRTLPDGVLELVAPSAPLRVVVRNDACCESETRTIQPGQLDEININLSYLAAQVTPRCDGDDVQVQVGGKDARIGKPSLISFPGTIAQRDVEVVFVIGQDKVDRHQVAVRPKDDKQVTCAR